MTFLGSAGREQARRRRDWEKREQDVHERTRRWLELHPPRVELPVELGRWSTDRLENRYEVDFFGMERRGDRWLPRGVIVQVPVMDRRLALEMWQSAAIPDAVQVVDFRPVKMRFEHNQTRVTWYNWEPTRGMYGDAEADIYSAMGKLEAMLSRVPYMHRDFDFVKVLFAHAEKDFSQFMRECLDAIGEWRGKVRSYYVVPGRKPGDPPEERER
jgi:hypothetical protein